MRFLLRQVNFSTSSRPVSYTDATVVNEPAPEPEPEPEHSRVNHDNNGVTSDTEAWNNMPVAQNPARISTPSVDEFRNAKNVLTFMYRGSTNGVRDKHYTQYKLIGEMVCYEEDGEIKQSSVISVGKEGQILLRGREQVVNNKGILVPRVMIPNIEERFNSAPTAFYFRGATDGQADKHVNEYKLIDGVYYYKENGVIQKSEIIKGEPPTITVNGEEIEQAIHDGVLVPKEFADLAAKYPDRVFHHEAIVNGRLEGFRTTYIIKPDNSVWYFENGVMMKSKSINENNLNDTLHFQNIDSLHRGFTYATEKSHPELTRVMTEYRELIYQLGREKDEFKIGELRLRIEKIYDRLTDISQRVIDELQELLEDDMPADKRQRITNVRNMIIQYAEDPKRPMVNIDEAFRKEIQNIEEAIKIAEKAGVPAELIKALQEIRSLYGANPANWPVQAIEKLYSLKQEFIKVCTEETPKPKDISEGDWEKFIKEMAGIFNFVIISRGGENAEQECQELLGYVADWYQAEDADGNRPRVQYLDTSTSFGQSIRDILIARGEWTGSETPATAAQANIANLLKSEGSFDNQKIEKFYELEREYMSRLNPAGSYQSQKIRDAMIKEQKNAALAEKRKEDAGGILISDTLRAYIKAITGLDLEDINPELLAKIINRIILAYEVSL